MNRVDQPPKENTPKTALDRRIVAAAIVAAVLIVLGIAYYTLAGPLNRGRDDSNVFKRPSSNQPAPGGRKEPFNPLAHGK